VQHNLVRDNVYAHSLTHSLNSRVCTCSSTILYPRHVPNALKTIKPCDLGGMAGGEKYLHQNLLFKFAVDTVVRSTKTTKSTSSGGNTGQGSGNVVDRPVDQVDQQVDQVDQQVTWMCGGDSPSDEDAMKVAGNELRGLISVFKCGVPGLALPLMALIDYLGFRLIAIALLPIDRSTMYVCAWYIYIHIDIYVCVCVCVYVCMCVCFSFVCVWYENVRRFCEVDLWICSVALYSSRRVGERVVL
jgi:Clustered mitochondria